MGKITTNKKSNNNLNVSAKTSSIVAADVQPLIMQGSNKDKKARQVVLSISKKIKEINKSLAEQKHKNSMALDHLGNVTKELNNNIISLKDKETKHEKNMLDLANSVNTMLDTKSKLLIRVGILEQSLDTLTKQTQELEDLILETDAKIKPGVQVDEAIKIALAASAIVGSILFVLLK